MTANKWTNADRFCMTRALELARRGWGKTEPNPAVGAILARGETILGRGFHRIYGGPHAEVVAFHNAKQRGNDLREASLYVTLEPCCHWGKTPPCTDAVIASGIKNVVVAAIDPSKKVGGKGIAALQAAGIKVRVGLLADQARSLNPWFYKFHETSLPWVVAKWAQTLDGKLAARTGLSRWISGDLAREYAHRIRRTCQAIVVGVGTVLADNPNLTVRLIDQPASPAGPPNRVIFDSRLRTPTSCTLVQTAKEVPTWIVTSRQAGSRRTRTMERQGVRVIVVPSDHTGKINLKAFLKFAARQGWARIMVEGGAEILSAFLREKLADELAVFQTGLLALDNQACQFSSRSPKRVDQFVNAYALDTIQRLGGDVFLRFLRTW